MTGCVTVKDLLDKYNIKNAVLKERYRALGISPTKEEGEEYFTTIDASRLDELNEYILLNGGIEGYVKHSEPSEQLRQFGDDVSHKTEDLGAMVISKAHDIAVAPTNTTDVSGNTMQGTNVTERIHNNPNRGLNAARVREAGLIYAEEEEMARAYAEKLLENPENLPPEILQEIETFKLNLDVAMPKPKRQSAEDIAAALLKEFKLT